MTRSIDTTRFAAFLASLFALVAAVLSVVGIYSVVAYVVADSRRETAIRIALGASGAIVLAGVMRRAISLTTAGIVFGSLGAWVLTRLLAGLFLGVDPHDPGTFAGAAIGFFLVALAAAAIPALRTARINPVSLLATS